MANVNPKCFKQSASSTATFKKCPQAFRLAYREGLRLKDETETQRIGTGWHGIHETFANKKTLESVVEYINERYKSCPPHFDLQKWELEREILWVSFNAYQWYWQNDPVEILASELPFDLPMLVPGVGLPLPLDEVSIVGKIDHLIRWNQGMVGSKERKSTTRDIDPSGKYWDRSKKDTQVSTYALALRELEKAGKLPVMQDVTSFGNTLYDVWRRPTIKPAMLTQKETAEFIATGTYCEQQFEVETGVSDAFEQNCIFVNGAKAEIEPGKKGFAIRETVPMFGARLLQDIYANPGRYFQRKEIVRTDAELAQFRITQYNIYQAQKEMARTGGWYENENSCDDPYPCSYKPICFGPGASAVCDGKTVPENYKRIFVDLTVRGDQIEE